METVKLWLNAGADVDAEYENGRTPLVLAAQKGSFHVVKALLQHMDHMEKDTCGKTKNLALAWASHEGHNAIVQLLLDAGADPNAEDDDGVPALHFATSKGDPEVVKILLYAGANVYATDKTGMTALHLAKKKRNKAVSTVLTATQKLFSLCQSSTSQLNKVNTAIILGAVVNAKDEDGQTPLHLAIIVKNTEAIELLLKKGADVTAKDKWGNTPAKIATNPKIQKLLYGNKQRQAVPPQNKSPHEKELIKLKDLYDEWSFSNPNRGLEKVQIKRTLKLATQDEQKQVLIASITHGMKNEELNNIYLKALVQPGTDLNRRIGADNTTYLILAAKIRRWHGITF